MELRKVLTGCDDDDAAVGDDDEDEPVVAVGRGSATDRVLFHVVLASVRTTSFLFAWIIERSVPLLYEIRQVATVPWC